MITALTFALVAGLSKPVDDLTPAEKIYGLSRFWKEASDHFAFFDRVPDLDWDKTYEEYIPKVLATKSKDEYYDELTHFCALLRDSHTRISYPKDARSAEEMTPPLGAKTIGDRSFVASVPKPADKEIPLKSEIIAVEGQPPQEYFKNVWGPKLFGTERQMSGYSWLLLAKPKGEVVNFTIKTPEGEKKDVSLKCAIDTDITVTESSGAKKTIQLVRDAKGIPEYVNIPPHSSLQLGPYAPVQYKDLGDGIAYVRLNTFMDPKAVEQFEALVPTLEKAKGLLIDLRTNGGGDDAIGMKIAQNFTTGTFKSFQSKSREVVSAFKAWGQSVKPYELDDWSRMVRQHYLNKAWRVLPPTTFQGKKDAKLLMPKVVLIGGGTASAAEDTLIYYSQIPNITTVGQNTYGGTGQPLFFDLPGGGKAQVCTQRCTFPDGKEYVGPGIAPDIEVPITPDEYWTGHDATFEKGLEVLKGKLK